MHKNCSFFDVDSKHDEGLSDRFNGIEIEGRSVRVNRDDDGNKRSKKVSSSFKRKTEGRRKVEWKGRKSKQDFHRSRKRRR